MAMQKQISLTEDENDVFGVSDVFDDLEVPKETPIIQSSQVKIFCKPDSKEADVKPKSASATNEDSIIAQMNKKGLLETNCKAGNIRICDYYPEIVMEKNAFQDFKERSNGSQLVNQANSIFIKTV